MNRLWLNQWVIACALVCVAWMWPASAEEAIPKHLQVARDIVKNVKPENNYYTNDRRYVRFPGDLFTSEYHVHTNCTGLVESSMEKAYDISPKFSTRKFSSMYSIIDWVDGVDRGEMFDKITKVQDVQLGDFVLWKFIIKPAGVDPAFNGHIVTIDSLPKKIEPQRKPVMEGTTQWELWVIDSNSSAISFDDTRYVAKTSAANAEATKVAKKTGAGRGRIYLYTNEAGEIVGQSFGFASAKVNVQDVDRHIVMARVRYNEIKK